MFYAVKTGRKPGIYRTWDECEAQVKGYSGAVFKKFDTEKLAKEFVNPRKTRKKKRTPDVIIYTDGSFDGDRRIGGFAAVFVEESIVVGSLSGRCTKDPALRNIGAEIEAAEVAITTAIERGYKVIDIIHDYTGVGCWADQTWQANNPVTQCYVQFIWDARKKADIRFFHVKGHSGNEFNERADFLAALGADGDSTTVYFGKYSSEKETV